jgi:hypothetical protein
MDYGLAVRTLSAHRLKYGKIFRNVDIAIVTRRKAETGRLGIESPREFGWRYYT